MNTPIRKTRTVSYPADQPAYRVVVAEATAQMGMLRSVLINSAGNGNGKGDDPIADTAQWIMRRVLYPAFIAGTVEHEFKHYDHWPLSYEEFCSLPEQFELAWETAVFELNPHWRIRQGEPDEQDKKKVTISSGE